MCNYWRNKTTPQSFSWGKSPTRAHQPSYKLWLLEFSLILFSKTPGQQFAHLKIRRNKFSVSELVSLLLSTLKTHLPPDNLTGTRKLFWSQRHYKLRDCWTSSVGLWSKDDNFWGFRNLRDLYVGYQPICFAVQAFWSKAISTCQE